jgi:Transmembrane domain of unknown function (DUF3566)
MTERPTEQTHPRLTGLDATSEGGPILPPMPEDQAGPEYRPQSATTSQRPSLADRLQERLSSARQTDKPSEGLANGQEQTSVRPAVQTSPAAPAAAVTSPEHDSAVLPAPATEQAPRQAAQRTAATRPARPARGKRPPRRARLRLTRIDPWSVMKTAFLLSIALGVVTIVSVLMVWSVLGAAGVWDSINTTVRDVVGDQASTPFTIQDYLGTDRVIGFTMLVAVIDVVLLTAIATLAAFLYNMAAALLGGIDITLVEDER